MIKKLTLFCAILVISTNLINAQKEIECKTKLSLFHEAVKAKKYDAAYEPWLYVKDNCPDLSLAIYADGEKILKHKIESTEGELKIGFIKGLLNVWKKRSQYFESLTSKGEYEARSCQLQYDNKDLLGEKNKALYHCFDDAFVTDSKTFKNPKSLYTYLSLTVSLYDEGKKSATELFNTYDNVNEKIEFEKENYSEKLNELIFKLERGELLTSREKNKRRAYESYLKGYTLIQNSINAKIDDRSVCENLSPLYSKGFEVHQNDSIWLKRSVSRMYHKKCTDEALYEKLVKQYDNVAPSADTKIFVATVLFRKGKDEEAYQYLTEGYRLETKPYKKSNLAIRIGVILKNKKQYSRARKFLLEALKLNPSNGKPHLIIAQMYALSAKNKNCGKDNFHQRAVFWLAAKEAKKASLKDPTLRKIFTQYVVSYEAKAPSTEDIFLSGLGGQTIKIGCWINRSIVVPKVPKL